MTNTIIDISNSKIENIDFLSNDEVKLQFNKGWSYSFMYSLIELRDIFIVIKKNKLNKGIPFFTLNYVVNKVPFIKSEWDSRRVLEAVNALKNFGLLNSYSEIIKHGLFENSQIGDPLSDEDKQIFTNIYFEYFRFKEIASLFVNPSMCDEERLLLSAADIIQKSTPLFSFISKKGYVDSFFNRIIDNPDLYIIPEFNKSGDNNSGLKRFWDVFISWGQQLGIIERFNMKNIGYKLSNDKTFGCNYFVSNINKSISINEFINNRHCDESSIDIANLVLELCLKYRMRIEDAKEMVLLFYSSNQNTVSLVRTSEIFIKERDFAKYDKVLYPKYNDSFVSHLIIRK